MILNSDDLDILTVRTWNKHPELDGRLVVSYEYYYTYLCRCTYSSGYFIKVYFYCSQCKPNIILNGNIKETLKN